MTFEGLTPVSYEVTVVVEERLADALERYLPGHIDDVMATGVFARATLERVEPGRYRTRYEAPSQASLDRYLAEVAPPLRADFIAHFPDGVSVSREVWSEVYRHEVETE